MPNQAPAHWSKDFVEHLRTVHFALIATAVALVIVAVTTKPYSTAVAARELRQIQDLRSQWSLGFVRDKLEAGKVKSWGFPYASLRYVSNNGDPTIQLRIKGVQTRYSVAFESVECHDDRDMLGLPSPPETITRFGVWWNSFEQRCYVLTPVLINGPKMRLKGTDHRGDIVEVSEIDSSPKSKKAPPIVSLSLKPDFDIQQRTLEYWAIGSVLPQLELEKAFFR
jgi:hypothetical protein